jgi:glycerol-3-phosphate dehydrogenase (NAD(P)+)
MNDLKVAVLGGGSWGTTVAALTARNVPVTLWARNPKPSMKSTATTATAPICPDATLPGQSCAPSTISARPWRRRCGGHGHPVAEFPQRALEVTRAPAPLGAGDQPDQGPRTRHAHAHDRDHHELLPGHPIGVLTGPNLAREIMAGQAAASVIAMEDEIICRSLQKVFKSGLFRVYTNTT